MSEDTISPSLMIDLKLLRDGELTENDPVWWRAYSLQELSFALNLRRGSVSLHVHVVHALLLQYRQVKQRLSALAEGPQVQEELHAVMNGGAVEGEDGELETRLRNLKFKGQPSEVW